VFTAWRRPGSETEWRWEASKVRFDQRPQSRQRTGKPQVLLEMSHTRWASAEAFGVQTPHGAQGRVHRPGAALGPANGPR
jgi:hypothetical protein